MSSACSGDLVCKMACDAVQSPIGIFIVNALCS